VEFCSANVAHSAKNLAKCGGFLFRKCKVALYGKFHYQGGGFMLLTLSRMTSKDAKDPLQSNRTVAA
jgi:hypothetical protein